MKIEKFKVLLYLKKTRPDKSGKAPIMGRISINRSMVRSVANSPVLLTYGILVRVD